MTGGRKLIAIIAAVVLALGLSVGPARADLRVPTQTSIYEAYVTDHVPVGDGSEDLVAFTFYVVNTTGDAGYDPSSFDGMNSGYTGFTGKLHQHYSLALGTSTATADSVPYADSIDTHFLNVLADMLIEEAPNETIALVGSYEASTAPYPYDVLGDTDFGDQLTGVFAITPTGPRWDIAQIVMPWHLAAPWFWPRAGGEELFFDFYLSGTAGGERLYPIPEPATLSMLSLGGLALLRSRWARLACRS